MKLQSLQVLKLIKDRFFGTAEGASFMQSHKARLSFSVTPQANEWSGIISILPRIPDKTGCELDLNDEPSAIVAEAVVNDLTKECDIRFIGSQQRDNAPIEDQKYLQKQNARK